MFQPSAFKPFVLFSASDPGSIPGRLEIFLPEVIFLDCGNHFCLVQMTAGKQTQLPVQADPRNYSQTATPSPPKHEHPCTSPAVFCFSSHIITHLDITRDVWIFFL
jgi:hypothetical protein